MLKYLLKSVARTAFRTADKSYNTPERKGARGERKVHNALNSVLDESEYRVLSDLILPIAGSTTQLDHLVLSRFGIFVIETKNMSGWIFGGGADQQKWTCLLYTSDAADDLTRVDLCCRRLSKKTRTECYSDNQILKSKDTAP